MRLTTLLLPLLPFTLAASYSSSSSLTTPSLPTWSVSNFKITSLHLNPGDPVSQYGQIHYRLNVSGPDSSARCDAVTDSDALTACDKFQVPVGFGPHGCDGTGTSPWSWALNVSTSAQPSREEVFVLRIGYSAPDEETIWGCYQVAQNQTCTEEGRLVVKVPERLNVATQMGAECIFG